MKFITTDIPDLFILEPERHQDEWGYFARTFCAEEFAGRGITFHPVQSNISYNKAAFTLRGLHFHAPPYEETKLVRCTSGSLFDVAVDLRSASPAYKKWVGIELTRENGLGFFIPPGCAHGFLTLEDHTEVSYQMSPAYVAGHDRGLRWNDPSIGIVWPADPVIISKLDQELDYIS